MKDTFQLPVYSELFRLFSHLYVVATTGESELKEHVETKRFAQEAQEIYATLTTPWFTWVRAQQTVNYFLEIQENLSRRIDRTDRLAFENDLFVRVERALFFREMLLHFWSGARSWTVNWGLVEQVSSLHIDESLRLEELACAPLPRSLWIEWNTPPATASPWVRNARGLLISRIPIFEAPLEDRHAYLQENETQPLLQVSYFLEALREMAKDRSCGCYLVFAVLKGGLGLQFVPNFLGHEYSGSIKDMLDCHTENMSRDRPKLKETHLTWAPIGIKLLLYAAARKIFIGDSVVTNTTEDSIPEIGQHSGMIYRQKQGAPFQIQMVKEERTPFRLQP